MQNGLNLLSSVKCSLVLFVATTDQLTLFSSLPLFSSCVPTPGFVHYLYPELLLGQFHILHLLIHRAAVQALGESCHDSPLALSSPILSVNYLLCIVIAVVVVIIVHSTLNFFGSLFLDHSSFTKFSLSLSLSHTHTHTTDTRFLRSVTLYRQHHPTWLTFSSSFLL